VIRYVFNFCARNCKLIPAPLHLVLTIPLSEVQWKTGTEPAPLGTVGLNLGTQDGGQVVTMGKHNCCVPNCTNNWRNSPELKFHSLPNDPKVLADYKRLIRNDNLKVSSTSTKICGGHFPGGERVCRTQLPSIFPWSTTAKTRREIIKHDIPKRRRVSRSPSSTSTNIDSPVTSIDIDDNHFEEHASLCTTSTNSSQTNTDKDQGEMGQAALDEEHNKEAQLLKEKLHALQRELEECKDKLSSVQKELEQVKYKYENDPKFDIKNYEDCDEDISFFTGFPNYASMVLCFDMLKEKAENLSYGSHQRLNFVNRKSGPKRKLSVWQEFTLVLQRLRLGLLERDLADRYRVSVSTVSDIIRTWIKFMKSELQYLCIVWPSKEQLKFYMPSMFKELYPELVSIIDCTELRMESPSSLDKQSMCYSSYKSHTTMKALVGITPNGAVSFVSELYSGSISDPDIVKR